MANFLENLKTELDETSELHPTVTVKRSDLENLIKAHEKQSVMGAGELEAIVRALSYWKSEFGMTDKEQALFDRLQKDLKGAK